MNLLLGASPHLIRDCEPALLLQTVKDREHQVVFTSMQVGKQIESTHTVVSDAPCGGACARNTFASPRSALSGTSKTLIRALRDPPTVVFDREAVEVRANIGSGNCRFLFRNKASYSLSGDSSGHPRASSHPRKSSRPCDPSPTANTNCKLASRPHRWKPPPGSLLTSPFSIFVHHLSSPKTFFLIQTNFKITELPDIRTKTNTFALTCIMTTLGRR